MLDSLPGVRQRMQHFEGTSALLKAFARAFRWQRLLDEGRYGSISELAQAERIERGYLGRVLQLTLMPPWLVEAIVDGRQGVDVTLPGLMTKFETLWRYS